MTSDTLSHECPNGKVAELDEIAGCLRMEKPEHQWPSISATIRAKCNAMMAGGAEVRAKGMLQETKD